MADLSKLTTEQLQELRAKKRGGRDITSLITGKSTEELIEIRNRKLARQRIESERGTMQNIDDRVRAFANGTIGVGGWNDEIAAGLGTGFGFVGDYPAELSYQRERDADFAERHPYESAAWNIGGGVASAIGAGRAGLFPAMPASMTGKIAQGIGYGTALGAEEGFARGEGGVENRIDTALPSAGIGAGFGMGAPLLGKAAGAAWNGIASWLANRGVDAKAIGKIVSEMQSAGLSPDDAAQRLQQLGPEGMIADTAPGMQTLAGGTMTADSGAATIMGQRLGARLNAAPARVSRDLDTAFGPSRDPYGVRQATRVEQSSIGPQYREAIENAPPMPGDLPDTLARQLTDPSRNMALANRGAMQNIMTQIDDALAAGDPQTTAARLLNVRQWLDSQIVYDPRALSQLSNADRANQAVLQQARSTVDDVLKRQVPGIEQADQLYSTSARNQRAFDEGRKNVLRGGADTMTPDELLALQARSSAPENLMRSQGVRTELDRTMSNPRRNPGLGVERIMNRDWNREKIGAMIGPQRAQRLADALDRESTFLETSNLADPRRGSRTAPLSETARRVWGKDAGPSTLGDMVAAGTAGTAVGGPQMGLIAAAGAGAGGLRRMMAGALSRGEKPEVIQRAADALTATGRRRDAIVAALMDKADQMTTRARKTTGIERIIAALLLPQAGKAGYEGQRLALPGRAGR